MAYVPWSPGQYLIPPQTSFFHLGEWFGPILVAVSETLLSANLNQEYCVHKGCGLLIIFTILLGKDTINCLFFYLFPVRFCGHFTSYSVYMGALLFFGSFTYCASVDGHKCGKLFANLLFPLPIPHHVPQYLRRDFTALKLRLLIFPSSQGTPARSLFLSLLLFSASVAEHS